VARFLQQACNRRARDFDRSCDHFELSVRLLTWFRALSVPLALAALLAFVDAAQAAPKLPPAKDKADSSQSDREKRPKQSNAAAPKVELPSSKSKSSTPQPVQSPPKPNPTVTKADSRAVKVEAAGVTVEISKLSAPQPAFTTQSRLEPTRAAAAPAPAQPEAAPSDTPILDVRGSRTDPLSATVADSAVATQARTAPVKPLVEHAPLAAITAPAELTPPLQSARAAMPSTQVEQGTPVVTGVAEQLSSVAESVQVPTGSIEPPLTIAEQMLEPLSQQLGGALAGVVDQATEPATRPLGAIILPLIDTTGPVAELLKPDTAPVTSIVAPLVELAGSQVATPEPQTSEHAPATDQAPLPRPAAAAIPGEPPSASHQLAATQAAQPDPTRPGSDQFAVDSGARVSAAQQPLDQPPASASDIHWRISIGQAPTASGLIANPSTSPSSTVQNNVRRGPALTRPLADQVGLAAARSAPEAPAQRTGGPVGFPFDSLPSSTFSVGQTGPPAVITSAWLAFAMLLGWRALQRQSFSIPGGIVLSSPLPPG
jgi:hypothetical protein